MINKFWLIILGIIIFDTNVVSATDPAELYDSLCGNISVVDECIKKHEDDYKDMISDAKQKKLTIRELATKKHKKGVPGARSDIEGINKTLAGFKQADKNINPFAFAALDKKTFYSCVNKLYPKIMTVSEFDSKLDQPYGYLVLKAQSDFEVFLVKYSIYRDDCIKKATEVKKQKVEQRQNKLLERDQELIDVLTGGL